MAETNTRKGEIIDSLLQKLEVERQKLHDKASYLEQKLCGASSKIPRDESSGQLGTAYFLNPDVHVTGIINSGETQAQIAHYTSSLENPNLQNLDYVHGINRENLQRTEAKFAGQKGFSNQGVRSKSTQVGKLGASKVQAEIGSTEIDVPKTTTFSYAVLIERLSSVASLSRIKRCLVELGYPPTKLQFVQADMIKILKWIKAQSNKKVVDQKVIPKVSTPVLESITVKDREVILSSEAQEELEMLFNKLDPCNVNAISTADFFKQVFRSEAIQRHLETPAVSFTNIGTTAQLFKVLNYAQETLKDSEAFSWGQFISLFESYSPCDSLDRCIEYLRNRYMERIAIPPSIAPAILRSYFETKKPSGFVVPSVLIARLKVDPVVKKSLMTPLHGRTQGPCTLDECLEIAGEVNELCDLEDFLCLLLIKERVQATGFQIQNILEEHFQQKPAAIKQVAVAAPRLESNSFFSHFVGNIQKADKSMIQNKLTCTNANMNIDQTILEAEFQNTSRRNPRYMDPKKPPPKIIEEKPAPFKAKEIPWFCSPEAMKAKFDEEERKRKQRIVEHSHALYQESKLPDRLFKHEQVRLAKKLYEGEPQELEQSRFPFKPTITSNMPDFEFEQSKFAHTLELRKKTTLPTKIEPFDIRDMRVPSKTAQPKRIQSAPKKPKPMPPTAEPQKISTGIGFSKPQEISNANNRFDSDFSKPPASGTQVRQIKSVTNLQSVSVPTDKIENPPLNSMFRGSFKATENAQDFSSPPPKPSYFSPTAGGTAIKHEPNQIQNDYIPEKKNRVNSSIARPQSVKKTAEQLQRERDFRSKNGLTVGLSNDEKIEQLTSQKRKERIEREKNYSSNIVKLKENLDKMPSYMERINQSLVDKKVKTEKMKTLLETYKMVKKNNPTVDPKKIFSQEEQKLFEDAKYLEKHGFFK